MISIEGREVLGGLIVGLNGGQFISELFATVELPDFCEVNFGKPVFQLRVLFIGDHPVSQLAFGGDMVSTLESACELRQVPPGNQSTWNSLLRCCTAQSMILYV